MGDLEPNQPSPDVKQRYKTGPPKGDLVVLELTPRAGLTCMPTGTGILLTRWWWVWLPLLGAIGYVAVTALRRIEVRRRWHRSRLHWPWVGDLELKYATAQFTRTLGLLLRSGLPILSALRIARTTIPNMVVREGVERASTSVGEGGALAPSLAETLPPLAVQMLAVGEESGRLDELCLRVSETYDAEVRRTLRHWLPSLSRR